MANIKLNNKEYSIPDSVLADPRADFIAHLGTIAGNGLKVIVGDVEYSIDASKVAGAIFELEGVLDGMKSEDTALGLPITWNSIEVQGNLSIGGTIRVSEYAPSLEELQRSTITATFNGITIVYSFREVVANEGDLVTVGYTWYDGNHIEHLTCASVFAPVDIGDGTIVEAGFYTESFGPGENIDFVLDLVDSTEV